MPMSPSSFVPSERLAGGDSTFLPAGTVAPQKDYASQQIEQMGQAFSAAGSTALRTGQSMAYRIGETIDDANVKSAETQFLANGTAIARGYMQTLGKNAIDGYDDAAQALVKAKDDASQGLTNDIQKRMYNQAAQLHLVNFGSQMYEHNHQQTVSYGAGASKDRASVYAQATANAYQSRDQVDADGKPAGDFQTYWGTAVKEAQNAAQIGLGAPPGSPQSEAMVKATTTEIVRGVVARLINDHASIEAQNYYDKELAAGHIDESQAVSMGNVIRTAAEHDHNVNTGNQLMQDQLASHAQPAPSPGAADQGYQDWLKKNGIQESPGYDTYGAYKAGAIPDENGHLTDEYKLPTHPTYSTESLASQKPGAPAAGEWTKQEDGKWTFKASPTNIQNAGGVAGMKAYFDQVEPGNTVILPDGDSYTGKITPGEKSWEDYRPQAAPSTRIYNQPVEGGSITSVMGESRSGGRVHNGIDIAVPVGTPVVAPADGKVSKVWNDDQFGGGLSMEITHPDGSITGVAHLSKTNYQVGDPVTQGQQIALSGKSGNATGPVVHWNLKDPNGNYVDPRFAGGVPQKLENFTDPNDLDAVLQQIDNSGESDYMKKEQKSYVEGQYRHYRQIDDQKYEDLKKGVVDNWYAVDGDVSQFNPAQMAQFAQLRPGDQAQLKKGIPRESDEDTVLNLMSHPELVVPGSIEKYRDQLSKGDYRSFFKQAIDNATPDSAKVRAVNLDNDQFDSILLNNGMQALVSPKANTPQSYQKIQMVNSIRDQIDAEQVRTGQELSRDQKYKIMTDAIAQKTAPAYVDQGFKNVMLWPFTAKFGPGQQVPYADMTPAQRARAYVMVQGQRVMLDSIPPADRQAISIVLQKNNQPVTVQSIAEQYMALQKKRQQATPPSQ